MKVIVLAIAIVAGIAIIPAFFSNVPLIIENPSNGNQPSAINADVAEPPLDQGDADPVLRVNPEEEPQAGASNKGNQAYLGDIPDNATFVSTSLGEGIILSLQIDKTSYKPGENVSMRWILFNNSSRDVDVYRRQWFFDIDFVIWNASAAPIWSSLDAVLMSELGIEIPLPGPFFHTNGPFQLDAGSSIIGHFEVWSHTTQEYVCIQRDGAGSCSVNDTGSAPPGNYEITIAYSSSIAIADKGAEVGEDDSGKTVLQLQVSEPLILNFTIEDN